MAPRGSTVTTTSSGGNNLRWRIAALEAKSGLEPSLKAAASAVVHEKRKRVVEDNEQPEQATEPSRDQLRAELLTLKREKLRRKVHALRRDVRKAVKKAAAFEIQRCTKTLRQCRYQLEHSRKNMAQFEKDSAAGDGDDAKKEDIRAKLVKSQQKLVNREQRLAKELDDLKQQGMIDLLASALFEKRWSALPWLADYEVTRDFQPGKNDNDEELQADQNEETHEDTHNDINLKREHQESAPDSMVEIMNASKHAQASLNEIFTSFGQFVRYLEHGGRKQDNQEPQQNEQADENDRIEKEHAQPKKKQKMSTKEPVEKVSPIFMTSLNAGNASDDQDEDEDGNKYDSSGFVSDPNLSGDDNEIEEEMARRQRLSRMTAEDFDDDDDEEEIDDDAVERLLQAGQKKKKKNRPGQQARRRQYEQQYGTEANHLKQMQEKQQQARGAGPRRPERPGLGHGNHEHRKPDRFSKERQQSIGNPVRSGRPSFVKNASSFGKTGPVKQAAVVTTPTATPDPTLHPSWAAKKQQRERMTAALRGDSQSAAPNKIVFADEDDE